MSEKRATYFLRDLEKTQAIQQHLLLRHKKQASPPL
jgi:hypothetical protein